MPRHPTELAEKPLPHDAIMLRTRGVCSPLRLFRKVEHAQRLRTACKPDYRTRLAPTDLGDDSMLKTMAFCIAALLAGSATVLAQSATTRSAAPVATHSSAAKPSTPSNLASNQFSEEGAAKSHCPGDAVVWVNLGGSKAYHTSGDRYYGKTKKGAYMCQKEADQSGYHAAGSRAAGAKTTPTKATK
jgi:hypothetical protein